MLPCCWGSSVQVQSHQTPQNQSLVASLHCWSSAPGLYHTLCTGDRDIIHTSIQQNTLLDALIAFVIEFFKEGFNQITFTISCVLHFNTSVVTSHLRSKNSLSSVLSTSWGTLPTKSCWASGYLDTLRPSVSPCSPSRAEATIQQVDTGTFVVRIHVQ